mmetsp:Transcript_17102/g.19125  ORF Transcript_17102/g.19125 Transcript_17102/m.19125 type:complete len:182 (+) Transcript_17102:17-562(+)
MKLGFCLVIVLLLSSVSFSKFVLNNERSEHIEESTKIFAHNTRTVWTSFLAQFYHDTDHDVGKKCFTDDFANEAHFIVSQSTKQIRNLFDFTLWTDFRRAIDNLRDNFFNGCNTNSFNDIMNEHCDTGHCEVNTITFNVLINSLEMTTIFWGFFELDGKTDETYKSLGDGLGRMFNLFFGL